MTSAANSYVSSSLVKEIASFGGDVSTMVPSRRRTTLSPGVRPFVRRRRGVAGASLRAIIRGPQEGHRHRHHLPRRAPRVAIANGKKLPLTTNVVVDQNAALGLIDELRVAVPEEVRAAKRINSEGERIIEKAQEEAERIVGRAQEQAAFLIDERGLTQAAEAESRRIIDEAHADGRTYPRAAPTSTRSASSRASKATSRRPSRASRRASTCSTIDGPRCIAPPPDDE